MESNSNVNTVIIDENKKAIIYSIIIMIIIVAVSILAYTYLQAEEYLLLMVFLGWFGIFFIDLTLAWTGYYGKKRFYIFYLGMLILFVSLFISLLIQRDISTSFIFSFMSTFLFWFGMVFEAHFPPVSPAIYILRATKGLRVSGDKRKGLITTRIDQTFIQKYGTTVLEHQIIDTISSKMDVMGRISFAKAEKTKIGFNIYKANNINVLYRLTDNFVEILCIPIEGVVARFEKSDEIIKLIRFSLVELLGFLDPDEFPVDEKDKKAIDAYEIYRRPYRGRAIRIITFFLLVAGVVSILVLIIANIQPIWMMLTNSDISTGLSSLAALVFIFGVPIGIWKYLIKKKKTEIE